MSDFNPPTYGPVLGPLLTTDRCRPLDAGVPDPSVERWLRSLTVEGAFAEREISDMRLAQACLAGVWLLYDYLHESHAISQNLATPEGCYWHGIMHRREGDYSNAKYWFRSAGQHPIGQALAADADSLAHAHHATHVLPAGGWQADWFVDACQMAVERGTGSEFCRALQQAEWERLFDNCYRGAIGAEAQ